MSDKKKPESTIFTETIRSMMIDYVVHNYSCPMLCAKYKLSPKAAFTIIRQFQFKEKKLSYQDKLLQKSLDRLASRQASIVSRVTLIFDKQIRRLEKVLEKDPEKMIDSNRMKELIATYAILTKEHRLNNDQATDNQSVTIKVEMGGDVPIVTDNHLGTYEAESVPSAVDPTINPIDQGNVPSPDEMKVIVERSSNDSLVIDDEDSNDMFGSID